MKTVREGLVLKRAMDIAMAASVLLLLGPSMLIIGALIRIRMGSPILFRQVRPGQHGKPFTLVKFRTMVDEPGADGEQAAFDARITELGSLLRRTSLDELPEAWNILKGDMSMVGPRPLLMEYLPLYTDEQARRHDVKPGLTGWAQIHGRRGVDMQERIALDVWYVDHRSLALDIRIMATTASQVARGEGAEPTRSLGIDELGFVGNPADVEAG